MPWPSSGAPPASRRKPAADVSAASATDHLGRTGIQCAARIVPPAPRSEDGRAKPAVRPITAASGAAPSKRPRPRISCSTSTATRWNCSQRTRAVEELVAICGMPAPAPTRRRRRPRPRRRPPPRCRGAASGGRRGVGGRLPARPLVRAAATSISVAPCNAATCRARRTRDGGDRRRRRRRRRRDRPPPSGRGGAAADATWEPHSKVAWTLRRRVARAGRSGRR